HFAGAASGQSARADRAYEPAPVRRQKSRRRCHLVVRRRDGPDTLLRLRGGRRAFPRLMPRCAGAVRRRLLPALQALVRRLLPDPASQRAARRRRHFSHSFALTRAVGDAFLGAYEPILLRRKDLAYGEREREFQTYRRGRYVEFNLVYDRGTLFGLQSNGRTEAI